jgi:DNA-binding NtrC family response regulator
MGALLMNNARVLIVDDESLIAHSLQAFLEDEGMRVESVGSAEEALDLIRRGHSYDVCIMDLRLPGLDGNGAIRALHELCPELRFIIHTGSVNYRLTEELSAMGTGEIPLFRKPLLDMALLATKIRVLAYHPS